MTTDSRKAAAFFDLDRTLIAGSSVYTWAYVAWRRKMMPTQDLLADTRKAIAFRLNGSTDEVANGVRDRILHAIKGHTREELAALGDEIIPRLIEDVRSESRGLIDLHREAGRTTYVVTASPIELVEPFAQELGLTGAIATVAETIDGVYTGELSQPFCYGPGKAENISTLAAEEGLDLELCYGYSDSASDLPMLELVGHPVAVNPDSELEAIALARGWPIVEFSRKAKAAVRNVGAAAGAAAFGAAGYVLGRRSR